ncbi:MAG: hypothetical protein N3D16_08180, partial [Anaerolineales bacterium]|nr:hypothetical protein [Anaerolineales bacterium]
MTQSKLLPPTPSSTRLDLFLIAPFYGALSLLCMFLLGKIVVWQVISLSPSSLPLTRPSLIGSLPFFSEFLLIGILALTLQQSLRAIHLSTKNSLRGGFLGACLVVIFAVAYLWQFSRSLALWGLLIGFLAAFGGALVATARLTSLWEENLPPAAETERRVLEQHSAYLG